MQACSLFRKDVKLVPTILIYQSAPKPSTSYSHAFELLMPELCIYITHPGRVYSTEYPTLLHPGEPIALDILLEDPIALGTLELGSPTVLATTI